MDARTRFVRLGVVRLAVLGLLAACLPQALASRGRAGQGPAPRHLWVLQAPASLAEHDLPSFTPGRTLAVPGRLLDDPARLEINGKGQMLFAPAANGSWQRVGPDSPSEETWFWDGRQARTWTAAESAAACGAGETAPGTEISRRRLVSADGESLFCVESRYDYKTEEGTPESSPRGAVRSSVRVWRSDLAGGRPEVVASQRADGWCACATGACEETCPEWEFWSPEGGVGEFFLLTRVTPGQLHTTWHETLVYRRDGRAWRSSRLPKPVALALAASATGDVLISAELDGACCGWDNEASDRLTILRDGRAAVLYDEFARYANADYDVSFYPADARLAPGGSLVAYTLASTARPGAALRLSPDGRENPAERGRVLAAAAEMPTVEVMRLDAPARPVAVIPRAALVGWLGDTELLVARDGQLAAFDTQGRARRTTGIRVRSAADAYVR